jgi:L-fucose isomerase-like protein
MKIKPVAYRGAPGHLVNQKMASLKAMYPDLAFDIVEEDPDILYFLSGGSEREAVTVINPHRMTLLLAGFEDNAFAAAMEVKAWADRQGVAALLMPMEEAMRKDILQHYSRVCEAYRMLDGQRAGLIGNVSHWLVASDFPLKLARQGFGIHIQQLLWEDMPAYKGFAPDQEFLDAFAGREIGPLEAEAGVYGFLQYIIRTHKLDAITLECFDMVNDHSVTACLALALLNSRGIVAGCEGDLVSLIGLMFIKALTGEIPWMANVAGLQNGKVILAHCTAPLNLLSDYRLSTHFETDKSAAIEGRMAMEAVTLFRFGMDLDKAFVATGRVVGHSGHSFACRTQTEVQLQEADMKTLLTHPLGNHHLVVPGDWTQLIRLACKYKGMAVL